ncbi:MAG: hypothetical protein CM15mV127_410 [Caudoviricetes sp.]|nr:MAG: hypothetical protein CM15mV127_410 [Caudoviricetes sp.]
MLQKLNFKPGFNKQATDSGAEGQWAVDGDFVRFRYGSLPEKIGGWEQLTVAHEIPYLEPLEDNMLLQVSKVKNM